MDAIKFVKSYRNMKLYRSIPNLEKLAKAVQEIECEDGSELQYRISNALHDIGIRISSLGGGEREDLHEIARKYWDKYSTVKYKEAAEENDKVWEEERPNLKKKNLLDNFDGYKAQVSAKIPGIRNRIFGTLSLDTFSGLILISNQYHSNRAYGQKVYTLGHVPSKHEFVSVKKGEHARQMIEMVKRYKIRAAV